MSKVKYRNILKNLGVNFFGQFVGTLIQFFSVPIFLKFWGIDLYGDWLILSTLPSYLSLSDIGFGSAAANKMTMLVATDNRHEALEVFQSTFLTINILCITIIAIFAPLAYLIPLENWLNLSNQTHSDVSITIIVMSLYVLSSLQGNFLMSGFRCNGNYAQGNLILIITRITECFIVLVSVTLGAKLVLVSTIFFVVRSFGWTVLYLVLKVRVPWLKLGFNYSSFTEIKQLFQPAITFMAIPLGNAINNQRFLMVVAISLNPASVAIFSTMRTLSRFAFQIVNGIGNAVWPELSAAYGAGDLQSARNIHRRSVQASAWMSILASAALLAFGQQIINIWTNGKIPYNPVLFGGFLIIVIVNTLWFSSSIALVATNNHSNMSIRYVSVTIISIILSLILAQRVGMYGIIICICLGDLFMNFYVLRASLRILDDSFKYFVRALFSIPSFRFY